MTYKVCMVKLAYFPYVSVVFLAAGLYLERNYCFFHKRLGAENMCS